MFLIVSSIKFLSFSDSFLLHLQALQYDYTLTVELMKTMRFSCYGRKSERQLIVGGKEDRTTKIMKEEVNVVKQTTELNLECLNKRQLEKLTHVYERAESPFVQGRSTFGGGATGSLARTLIGLLSLLWKLMCIRDRLYSV